MMIHPKIIAKLPTMIPRALAGDPAAIAFLTTAGIIVTAQYFSSKK